MSPHFTSLPCTASTRAEWQAVFRQLQAPLDSRLFPDATGYYLGPLQAFYGEPSRSLETFSRPLWGLAAYAAGGGVWNGWADMRRGLANGTDPAHPAYWGVPERSDQRFVEMAAIAFAICMAPDDFWAPLTVDAKANVAAWLGAINRPESKPSDNNWLWFRVMVNLALRSVGKEWNRPRMEADLARLDTFYLADGWYADGPHHEGTGGRRGDYYVGMALQFYALLYVRLAPDLDLARTETYRKRARDFAAQFIHWFAEDGAAIPFGRSLTYRFAQGAFWAGLAFADEAAMTWGQIRGVWARHMRWWLQQPVFADGGLLSIGYTYPNQIMAENYNAPGSPYWALKALVVLALPETHPFWQADEEPLPPRAPISAQPHSGKIITHGPSPRDSVALNLGDRRPLDFWLRNTDAKYHKFAYSTTGGFSVSASELRPEWAGLDSTLAFSLDGQSFHPRRVNDEERFAEGVLWAKWQPCHGISVQTWLIPWGSEHLRVHNVSAEVPCTSLEGGFAVACNRILAQSEAGERAGEAKLVGSPDVSGFAMPHGFIGFTGFSVIRSLLGEAQNQIINAEPSTHVLYPLTAIPSLRREHKPMLGGEWLVTWVLHSGDAQKGAAAWKSATPPEIETTAEVLLVKNQGEVVCSCVHAVATVS